MTREDLYLLCCRIAKGDEWGLTGLEESIRSVPAQGMVMVPREPTAKMRSAWIGTELKHRLFGQQGQSVSHGEREPDAWKMAYHAMLSASEVKP
jgi:hypothetical protein